MGSPLQYPQIAKVVNQMAEAKKPRLTETVHGAG